MDLFADYDPTRRGEPLPDLSIRPAVPGDAPAIAAISAARDGGCADELESRIVRQIEEPATFALLVAVHAGAVVGFGRVWRFRHDEDAPPDAAPEGWYLGGVVVVPAFRRRGIARALVARRLAWIAERADCAYYCANLRNRASLDLHAPFGFRPVARDFRLPGVAFTGGTGLLFRADVRAPA